MIFVGGRVRVTGGHEGVFRFSDVPVSATFGDGLALVIMVAAALSFALAAFKGYRGFADPIPGHADHAGWTAADFDELGEEIVEGGLERVDLIYEDAEEAIRAATEPPEDAVELEEDTLRFNAAIDDAKDELRAFAAAAHERRDFVAGEQTPLRDIDLSGFEALRIDIDVVPNSLACAGLLEALAEAHARASAEIATAHAAYVAASKGYRVPPPQPLPAA